jgi:hypothetical protein
MGLFSKRTPKEKLVRPDQVLKLVNLGMRETDAADRDIDSKDFQQAKEAFDNALRDSTLAEKTKAFDALRRHAY